MNEHNLEEMDKKADEAISNSSFGAFAASILPRPFDRFALEAIISTVGVRLARIYEVENNQPDSDNLKDIGGSIARGIKGGLPDRQATNGMLKYIPGVNIWLTSVAQPEVITALTHSVGTTFKEYFHSQLVNHPLTCDEVNKLAEKTFRNRLGADYR